MAKLNKLYGLVSKGKLDEIRELFNQDPNAVDLMSMPSGVLGYTPIHEAVSRGRPDILQVLLSKGGNVNALSNGNYSPIHIAASKGDVECIDVLLEFNTNFSLPDEHGRTPLATAKVNKRWKAARKLKTHEIKELARNDSPELRTMLKGQKRGQDVEESCFEDALEIAVHKNNIRAVGYLVLHGARNLEKCMQEALLKSQLQSTAVLLLLCHASKINDREMVEQICVGLHREVHEEDTTVNSVALTRKYLPKEWNQSIKNTELNELREAVRSSEMTALVTVACNWKNFDAAWIFLSEMYCKRKEEEAEWQSLDLDCVRPEWIERIVEYRKLVLSHNSLGFFPGTITDMKLLTRLDLSKNYIEEFPKELFEMKHLRDLNLSTNRMRFFPKVDNWTKSLKTLNLKENFITFIDNSISQSELENLNLSDNKLSCVPLCICEVKTLTVLDISRNHNITVLPPDLAKLSKLEYLGIEKMKQITDPPPSLREPTFVLLRHLRAKLRNSEPYYTMKLMIVGLANRGKTTLMHRINRDYAFDGNTSTQGIDIHEIKINKFTFKCWDFAGQEDYYATHQCFLSQRSLYLLVWSVEDGDDGIAGLKPWLDNLQFRVPRSAVIIVGTHLDKIDPSARTKSFEDDTIDRVFDLVSKCDDIFCDRKMIMLVTCCNAPEHVTECKSRFEKLRNLITAVADNITVDGKRNGQKVMGEMVPSSYLTLARMVDEKRAELEKEGRIPLLRRCQFQDLVNENATKHPRDYFDPEDIDVATEFLHNIGIILHYDDPNQDLRDLYFISPSWLCDLMAKVVTVKEVHSFIKDGILLVKNIPLIIGERSRFPDAFYPKYLRLLAKFQIACRVDNERLLVPSRLPSIKPGENIYSHEPCQTLTRIHSFSCIPNGFWSRFIGRFLLYLNEMLNVSQQNAEQSSLNQTVSNDQGDEDTDSDGSNSHKRESPSEAIGYRRDGKDASCSGERETSTRQNADHIFENEIATVGEGQYSRFVTELHNPDSTLQDNDTTDGIECRREYGTKVCAQHVNAETATRSVDCTSPPFILNSFRFDNEDVSSCDDPYPTDDNDSPRETTPTSFGSDSSLSCQFSTCCQDDSKAPSSDIFYHTNNSMIHANFPSSKFRDQEFRPVPRQVVTGSSSHFSQSGHSISSTDDAEQIFDVTVDLPYLLSHRYLVCWSNGILFKHPQLYLSVSSLSLESGRELVQTKVACTVLGYRALAFVVDHIRTLIKEWFPGLDGTDLLKNPYVSQLVPCPTCLTLGVNPPYHFNVVDCLKESLTRDYMVCGNPHTPQVIKLSELCPDLLFMDLDSSMQLKACDLIYHESDDSLLGSGGYGKVYQGTCSGKPAAIKIFNFKLDQNPYGYEALNHFYEVRQEAIVLSQIRHHPNVISFHGVLTRPKFCIVIELATMGTLTDALATQNMKRVVVYRIAQQIASAVEHLHSLGIIHRDLKSDNVLMFSLDSDSEVNIKLTDFGTANFVDPVGLKSFTGTPGFIAPEILEYLETEEYNKTVDVYSYGMVLYELISRRRPFQQVQSQFEINAMVKEGKRPAFYDLPDIRVRLLTLTELMLKCWVQEATNRPNMKDVSHQMNSPSFCLLYGKAPLRNVNSPRQLCFLQGTNEVWISCDDRTGASVVVVDLIKSDIKQKFIPENKTLVKAKDSFFNIVGIQDIDEQHVAIILRSTLDYVSIYSKDKKKLVFSHEFLKNYIWSMTVFEDYVVFGCDNGSFSKIFKKDLRNKKRGFLEGKLEKSFVTVNKMRKISSVVISKSGDEIDANITLGCGKYIYKYPFSPPDFEKVHPAITPTSDKKVICEMHVSEDGTILFVSHVGSPVISTILIDSMTQIGKIDCSHSVKILVPNSDMNDQRVTTFCISSDTLWVGTGSGHILLYEIKEDRALRFITWLKPYEREVRSLIACRIASTDPSHFVVSLGEEVNTSALCYDRNGLCLLTNSFPADPSDPSLLQRNSWKDAGRNKDSCKFSNKDSEGDVKEMLLIWEAPEAATLKKVAYQSTLDESSC